MSKVTVTLDGDEILVEYSGFKGRACFVDATKLKTLLKKMGVDIKGEIIRPKKEEMVLDGMTVTNGE